jgi:hypothetical protein
MAPGLSHPVIVAWRAFQAACWANPAPMGSSLDQGQSWLAANKKTALVNGWVKVPSHELRGLRFQLLVGRRLVMVLAVVWLDSDGHHQGQLTNDATDLKGKPIIIGMGGWQYTAKELVGIRVQILSTQSQAAQNLVEQARAAGYLIGW